MCKNEDIYTKPTYLPPNSKPSKYLLRKKYLAPKISNYIITFVAHDITLMNPFN